MNKSVTLLSTAAIVLFSNIHSLSAEAKSAAQLQKEANKLESQAANKEAQANIERTESSTAISEGKQGKASRLAKHAAKEQKTANE